MDKRKTPFTYRQLRKIGTIGIIEFRDKGFITCSKGKVCEELKESIPYFNLKPGDFWVKVNNKKIGVRLDSIFVYNRKPIVLFIR